MRYIFILLLPILAFGASFIETEDCITLQGDTDYILIKKTDAYIPPISGIIVHDYSGNGNDGTNYGAVYADCKLTFDGVNDYVDTGLIPKDNWQYKIKARAILLLDGARYIVGYRSPETVRADIGFSIDSWVYSYGSSYDLTSGTSDTETHTFLLSNGYFYVDNIFQGNRSYSFGTADRSVFLGARNYYTGSIEGFANCEIMEYECYTNNVLIQHFDFTTTESKYLRFTP